MEGIEVMLVAAGSAGASANSQHAVFGSPLLQCELRVQVPSRSGLAAPHCSADIVPYGTILAP